MVPSIYPVGTVTTLPPVSGCIPPDPVLIVEDDPAMQQEVENQLCLCYTEAEVCLRGILALGDEVMDQLGDTLDWQERRQSINGRRRS